MSTKYFTSILQVSALSLSMVAFSGCSTTTQPGTGDNSSEEDSATDSQGDDTDKTSDAGSSTEATDSTASTEDTATESGKDSDTESQSEEESTSTSDSQGESTSDSTTEVSDESTTETTDSSDTTSTTSGGDPIALYKELCAECHGEIGEGVDKKGYELQHPTREYFDWVTRNGRPGEEFEEPMPSYDETVITPEELEAMWDYLDTPAKPTTGEGLYNDYCGACHGADGKGGPTGVSGNHAEPGFTFHVREGFPDAPLGDRTGYMPAYDTTWLSDAELALIKEYLDSIGAGPAGNF